MIWIDSYETPAGQVRTGQVISTRWGRPHYTSIEVEHVVRERYRSPEGEVSEVVRFTGWKLFMGMPVVDDDGNRIKHLIRAAGVKADEPVRVHEDPVYRAREEGRSANVAHGVYGVLTGRADVAQLQAELDAFLADIGARPAAA